MEELKVVLCMFKFLLIDSGILYVSISVSILLGGIYYVGQRYEQRQNKRFATKYGETLDKAKKNGFYE